MGEVAGMLDASYGSVASTLKHARATLAQHSFSSADREPPPPPDSAAERTLIEMPTSAYAAGDLDGILAVLTADARLSMPSIPFEYHGRATAAQAPGQPFAHG